MDTSNLFTNESCERNAVAEPVIAELVEASKHQSIETSAMGKVQWWFRQAQPPRLSNGSVPDIIADVEPVVAEFVEASKRPLWEKSCGGSFDRLNHHD